MSLFPIEPPQPPPAPGRPARPRSGHSTPTRLLTAVATIGVLLGAGVAWRASTHPPTSPPATSTTTAGYTPQQLTAGSCIDASASVTKADDAPKRALSALSDGLTSWPVVHGPVKKTVASDAQDPLRLVIRLVEKNSYLTAASTSLVDITMPPYPGVTGTLPPTDAEDYAVRFAAYSTRVAQADQARQDQESAATVAADRLAKLARQRSTGSDVLGCVAAVAESTQPQDILVVSDLADTRLTEDDGSPRTFPASLEHTRIAIIQVCPSGSPKRCSAAAAAFTTGLQNMGLADGNVSIVRAERTEDQIRAWIDDIQTRSRHPLG